MNREDLIPVSYFCEAYEIPASFIESMQEFGMVEILIIDKEYYIEKVALPQVEKIVRLHNDLHINLEGIDVITNLLEQIEELKSELRVLTNRDNRFLY